MHVRKAVGVFLMLCASPTTWSQTTNSIVSPVSLIVPYPAGGASDITARILAEPIAREIKASVVVENIGGATGSIAAQKMLNAPADGRTIYQGSQNELILPPITIKGIRYQPTDFEILHHVTATRLVLVVRSGLPVSTLEDFIAMSRAKSTSDPLSYGSPGVGSLYHLIPDSMAKLAAVQYNHIPYKGSSPLMQDLIGDRLDFTVMAFSTTLLPLAEQGRFKIIANLSKDKPPELKHLPTLSDLEIFNTLDYASHAAYYVKKGTPEPIKQLLSTAIGNALSSPTVIDALEKDGRRVQKRMSIEKAELFYKNEVLKYEQVVELTGFKPAD